MHNQASAFARVRQHEYMKGGKPWRKTRHEIDHAGLELVLRDVAPDSRILRAQLRDLVGYLAARRNSEAPTLPDNLPTWEELDDRLELAGVRSWPY